MKTKNYIKELLTQHNCVVIPEFGAFLAHEKSASISGTTFLPPSKAISFNATLITNDGLLAAHASKLEGVTYEDALKQLLAVSKQWKKQLEIGIALSVDGVGKLIANEEGNYVFEPSSTENLLLSSFGMNPLLAKPILREVLKEEVVALEEKIPFIITPERKGNTYFRKSLKYAAVVLLAISTGITAFTSYNKIQTQQQFVNQQVQETVSKKIQEATFFDTTPLELNSLDLTITKLETPKEHHIVAGAFRMKVNADKKVAQLIAKGYKSGYIGVNKYGLHQVSYASFSDKNDAINYLYEIQKAASSDAWYLFLSK